MFDDLNLYVGFFFDQASNIIKLCLSSIFLAFFPVCWVLHKIVDIFKKL